LKLAYVLAQFLYTNKRLDLPGIGTFLIDPSVLVNAENNKQRLAEPEGISFENNPAIRDVPELISYISSKTGKMKALAISDLESHLELAHQFVNIGKPFLFEGIGTIAKIRPGEFEFIPGTLLTEKIKENAEKEAPVLSKKDTIEEKYQAYLATPAARSPWKKPVVTLLVLCGIGMAIWGGYTIATKNSNGVEASLAETNTEQQTVAATDTFRLNKPEPISQKTNILTSDNYKYVLEIAKSNRAFKRYNQLKTNQWKVQLETADSVQYKLFLLLPASADTTRTLDSLTVMTGKRVYIEPQN
jgi:hypothetical protein